MNRLKQLFGLRKNSRLKRYEFRMDEIDVDVYVEFFSRLAMPVEEAVKETCKIEGIETVRLEALLVLKQGAEAERKESEKGLKDRLDIMDLLLKADIDLVKYNSLLERHGIQHYKKRLVEIVQSFREGKYLNLNPRELKKRKRELLEKIKKNSWKKSRLSGCRI